MANKINTLSFLHDESIRHNNSRMEAVKRFYYTLSDYGSSLHYLEMNNSLSTDEHRAAFICALAKDIFVNNQQRSNSFELPISECTFKHKSFSDKEMRYTIETGRNKKTISITAQVSNGWDDVEIDYSFDCFSLASGIFIDEKTEGKTKITIDLDPEGDEVDEYRNDEDIRFVLDSLFKNLKLGMK